MEKLIAKAHDRIRNWAGLDGGLTEPRLSPILRDLWREAQVEALESVDKGIIDPFLTAIAVREALARLRSTKESK